MTIPVPHAYLTVEHTGPTVPGDEVDGLFESIVRSVAHAHGGAVHARARPDGGLAVTVQIPAR